MQKHYLLLSLIFVATISLTFTSCEKVDDFFSPDYVGYWTTDEIMPIGDQSITMRNTLSLTETSFESLVQIVEGTTMLKILGDLSVSGNEFTISPTSIGTPNPNTGSLEYVSSGDETWGAVLEEIEMQDSETANYVVVGDMLTLTIEGDAPQVFTRQLD